MSIFYLNLSLSSVKCAVCHDTIGLLAACLQCRDCSISVHTR